jgi:hypothetical protein
MMQAYTKLGNLTSGVNLCVLHAVLLIDQLTMFVPHGVLNIVLGAQGLISARGTNSYRHSLQTAATAHPVV